jgi:endo-1,4-beta-D-glucanase Y
MHRSSSTLLIPLALALLWTPLGCAKAGGGGGGSAGSTGSSSNNGGSTGSSSSSSNNGGSTGSSSSSNKGGSTSSSSSSSSSSSGGSSNKGGSSSGSSSSNNGGTTGSAGNSGSSSNNGGTTGSSSSSNNGGTTGSGGAAPGGSSGTGSGGGTTGSTGTSVAGEDVISDFESGKGDMIKQGGRTGYWYVYFPKSDTTAAPASPMKQTPALSNFSPIAGESGALHVTGSGFTASDSNYSGFGAAFKPHASPDKASDAYDVSAYSGISFKMKSGTGTPPAVYFEMLTKDNQPSTAGGSATNQKIDLYNTRGQLLNTPWTANAISSSYQTITVPFGTLIPRWVPDPTGCASATTPKCQAKPFVPANVLGLQISMYMDDGFPKPSGSTAGTYDLWIDDVAFVKGDTGLQTRTGFPLKDAGSYGSCIKPQGPSADAKFLVPAYNQWKATFFKGGTIIRPENGNDTVSEGIAYGMLIAVNMNDEEMFKSLLSYWNSHSATGKLMTWCIPSGGGSCSASGGSATDADEDAAYALLMAGKAWGGTYKADGVAMLKDIWDKDIDGAGTKIPKGGSNYASPTGAITNASYFAPSMYKVFAAEDAGHDWAGVITAVYKVLNGSITGSNGLIPAWCGSSCTAAASNGAATDTDYQYDSHRIPMRVGMDYCFNGTADAKAYTTKNTAFFVSAAANGMSNILDMYTPSGGAVTGTAPNSASIIGTAAVGAMATGNQAFLNDAYQAVFDSVTRGTMAPVNAAGKTPYSYYNATVGMLTLLIMTGNFMH